LTLESALGLICVMENAIARREDGIQNEDWTSSSVEPACFLQGG